MNIKAEKELRAISDFLHQQTHRITHIAVAHTQYKPFGQDAHGMQRIVEAAKKECLHFRNCLNRELYGRKARRKPLLYQPLMISTLEGSLITTDRNLTLHYNFSFGNLPNDMTDFQFQAKFRECWVDRVKQRDNIWHDVIAGDTGKAESWLGYSLKEASGKGNVAVWDFENTQIPYAAFGAG